MTRALPILQEASEEKVWTSANGALVRGEGVSGKGGIIIPDDYGTPEFERRARQSSMRQCERCGRSTEPPFATEAFGGSSTAPPKYRRICMDCFGMLEAEQARRTAAWVDLNERMEKCMQRLEREDAEFRGLRIERRILMEKP